MERDIGGDRRTPMDGEAETPKGKSKRRDSNLPDTPLREDIIGLESPASSTERSTIVTGKRASSRLHGESRVRSLKVRVALRRAQRCINSERDAVKMAIESEGGSKDSEEDIEFFLFLSGPYENMDTRGDPEEAKATIRGIKIDKENGAVAAFAKYRADICRVLTESNCTIRLKDLVKMATDAIPYEQLR